MANRKLSVWIPAALLIAVVALARFAMSQSSALSGCPGSQVLCPGVGCVSGPDKCVPGARGGPSAVFSKEGFEVGSFPKWSTVKPAPIERKQCPDGTRTDGPCLMVPQ